VSCIERVWLTVVGRNRAFGLHQSVSARIYYSLGVICNRRAQTYCTCEFEDGISAGTWEAKTKQGRKARNLDKSIFARAPPAKSVPVLTSRFGTLTFLILRHHQSTPPSFGLRGPNRLVHESTPLRKSQWGHAFQLMAPDGCDGTEFSSSFVFTHSPSFFVV
jgi:hypothetical protein